MGDRPLRDPRRSGRGLAAAQRGSARGDLLRQSAPRGSRLQRLASTQVARVTSRSQGLQRTIRLAIGPLAGASERFVSHPHAAEIYPKYLLSMLAVMRGILAVMGAARDRARMLARDDAVAAGIVRTSRST